MPGMPGVDDLNAAKYRNQNGGMDINAIVADMVQRSPWIYYSTLTQAAGVGLTVYDLFSNTQQTATGKKADTNMVRGNQFPTNRGLVMDYLGVYFSSAIALADATALLDNYYLEFKIDDKIQFEGPLQTFPSGFGIAGFSNITAAATDHAFTNGQPGWDHTRLFGDYCIYIAPLQQFSLQVICGPTTPPTFAAAVRAQFYIGGLTDRSVQ